MREDDSVAWSSATFQSWFRVSGVIFRSRPYSGFGIFQGVSECSRVSAVNSHDSAARPARRVLLGDGHAAHLAEQEPRRRRHRPRPARARGAFKRPSRFPPHVGFLWRFCVGAALGAPPPERVPCRPGQTRIYIPTALVPAGGPPPGPPSRGRCMSFSRSYPAFNTKSPIVSEQNCPGFKPQKIVSEQNSARTIPPGQFKPRKFCLDTIRLCVESWF